MRFRRRLAVWGDAPPTAAGDDEIARLDAALHRAAAQLAELRERERLAARELEARAADLAQANRNLEFTTRENETFVYSASHGLRTRS